MTIAALSQNRLIELDGRAMRARVGEGGGAGGVVGAPAVGADLTGSHQLLQRADQFECPIDGQVVEMQLVNVKVVGVEPGEYTVQAGSHVFRAAVLTQPLSGLLVEFRPNLLARTTVSRLPLSALANTRSLCPAP
jgi:hypothetical protein